MSVRILQGDCRDVMQTLGAGSVDAIVTDPPYGLSFMGKDWDHGIPGEHFWREALRVAKPGAHLLAFGGTRTFHRLMVAIEDAGWEIRDTVMWVYGSGFPKSHDVSKAIDKARGVEREKVLIPTKLGNTRGKRGVSYAGESFSGFTDVSEPATDAARQWSGWGTALKPAWEPVVVARKPLDGTVAANVEKHGTGALNIDACRVEWASQDDKAAAAAAAAAHRTGQDPEGVVNFAGRDPATWDAYVKSSNTGRWPANLIHDGSEEVLACFPESAGQQAAVKGTEPSETGVNCYGKFARGGSAAEPRGDSGSAARFFYCAKADRADRNDGLAGLPKRRVVHQAQTLNNGSGGLRNGDGLPTASENHHPTVKPTDLMRYLCRLVTPKGGTVLDPFMGSGSTLKAAELEGFSAIGIEINAEYFEIARKRIASDAPLFAEVA